MAGISRVDAAKALKERREAKKNFRPFLEGAFKRVAGRGKLDFDDSWHLGYFAEIGQAVYEGQMRQVAINVPPRELKSFTFSQALPAWILGKEPTWYNLCASYSATLATTMSVKCRRIMALNWYRNMFPDVVFTGDQNAKQKYDTTKGGGRIACSVGGTILGEGGIVRVLDDPHKTEAALSDVQRQSDIDWLYGTWLSREDDPAMTRDILIMQRLHYKDMTNEVVSELGWELITLPRVAPRSMTIKFPISGRIIKRKKGELLNPIRYPQSKVDTARKHSYTYEAQQQQNPRPLGGGRIELDWFPRFKQLPEFDEIVQSWDTASKTKEINNPSCCLSFGRKGHIWYLFHMWKDRRAYPKLKRKVINLFEYQTPRPSTVLIEDKSSGTSLIQDLKEEMQGNVVHPIATSIKPMMPEAEKAIRMETQSIHLENGLLALPDERIGDMYPWLSEVEDLLANFPDCVEWDPIDALSQFLKWQASDRVILAAPTPLGVGGSKWR